MLSDAKIRSLKPKEKAYKVYDDRGLYMVVNPNGSRWWRFKYKYDGRERGISLGVYPDVTLQYAREQLQEARQLLARGIDPSAQRRTVKIARADTFKVIAEEWLEMQAERLAPITMTKARWILGSFVYPRLGSRPIAEITAPEVLAVLRPIESRGMNETAHRALQRCGQIFRYAIATGRATRDITSDLRGALAPVVVENRRGYHRAREDRRPTPRHRRLHRASDDADRPEAVPSRLSTSQRASGGGMERDRPANGGMARPGGANEDAGAAYRSAGLSGSRHPPRAP